MSFNVGNDGDKVGDEKSCGADEMLRISNALEQIVGMRCETKGFNAETTANCEKEPREESGRAKKRRGTAPSVGWARLKRARDVGQTRRWGAMKMENEVENTGHTCVACWSQDVGQKLNTVCVETTRMIGWRAGSIID